MEGIMFLGSTHKPRRVSSRLARLLVTLLAFTLTLTPVAPAFGATQDPVTGAFEGTVTDRTNGNAIPNAVIQFINQTTQVPVAKRSDGGGKFYQGLLQPGVYRIVVRAQGYKTQTIEQRLLATRGNTVVPLPVVLEPDTAPAATTTTATNTNTPAPALPAPAPAPIVTATETIDLNATDGRRGGGYTENEVVALPTGDTTFTRTFDSFALLVPGIVLPPQTAGRVAGPGVGAGVGSAGQFSANGLRSRGNNFLVDGSDNNDEDIGVRRQGFFMLVPQPMESVKEYQVISAVAPAQFGRNLGATVNALSKSGGYETHGSVFGFLNTSHLNGREFFDTESDGQLRALDAFVNGRQRPVRLLNTLTGRDILLGVSNPAGKQESLTFGNVGMTLGGPLLERGKTDAAGNVIAPRKSAFYFFSLEGAVLNANRENHFAVPTVEQRGFAQSGATGYTDLEDIEGFPTSAQGDAVFSLYPFPNNPTGVYGRNTYTQILPASAQGYIGSFKADHSFKAWDRDQSITGRYNRTHDWRNIPATGGGLYATLRPVVGTQNFSFFWNGELTHEGATTPIFNQFRASYGRTRLNFEEERDRDNLIESQILPRQPFTLNTNLIENFTLPSDDFVDYRFRGRTTELGRPVRGGFGSIDGGALGLIGQVIMPGYSPLGVDVYNFPQRRVNNTIQLADILSFRKGAHSVALGFDYRRVQLNSDLPRNALPQLVFGGAPAINFDGRTREFFLAGFLRPDTLAAAQAASGFFQTLARGTSNIGLRYSQYNGFAQDEWRVRPNFSLSFGLRYEYNSPPNEVNKLIERTFADPALQTASVAGLNQFLNGRRTIFDADRNNLAPRGGFAYAKNWGLNKTTVFRGGYGLFYDQVIGAVVSQSRNVFPTFLTVNYGGGIPEGVIFDYQLFNPSLSLRGFDFSNGINLPGNNFQPYVINGTPNQFNPNIPLDAFVNAVNRQFPGGFGFTLPEKGLRTPLAHQYTFTVEQQLGRHFNASVAYVGTLGRKLLRLTTPNLGPNLNMVTSPLLARIDTDGNSANSLAPVITGFILGPGATIPRGTNITFRGGRPVPTAGAIFLYNTRADSRYDSLQTQVRGQFRKLSFQLSYTFSKALDDVSDVFDLAGAPALPQNSLRPSEYGLANFDTRHRLAYDYVLGLPSLRNANGFTRGVFGGYEIVGTGQFQTGQPFTVNSINDVNLDGNYTDRLNTTNGILVNNNGPNRLSIATNRNFSDFWAPIGSDGAVGRNSFRGPHYLLLNLGIVKNFVISETQRIVFRTDAFNFLNHSNFALPVRYLEAPGFGQSVDVATPARRIQFALKYLF
jgi:hypothetical protein